jgi:hypothetical protein
MVRPDEREIRRGGSLVNRKSYGAKTMARPPEPTARTRQHPAQRPAPASHGERRVKRNLVGLLIDQPPFEAYATTCGITFTFGGLRVDADAQVLDHDAAKIAGLYATGEMVGVGEPERRRAVRKQYAKFPPYSTCRESERCSRAPCSAAAAWFGRQGLRRIVYYRRVSLVAEVRTCPYVEVRSIWRASGTGVACG